MPGIATVRWQGLELTDPPKNYKRILHRLRAYAHACFYRIDRAQLFERTKKQRERLRSILEDGSLQNSQFAIAIGIDPSLQYDVTELRPSLRIGPNGGHSPQVIVALTQQRDISLESSATPQPFCGACTLIVDLKENSIEYAITKNINSVECMKGTAGFLSETLQDPIRALMITPQKEPFLALH